MKKVKSSRTLHFRVTEEERKWVEKAMRKLGYTKYSPFMRHILVLYKAANGA